MHKLKTWLKNHLQIIIIAITLLVIAVSGWYFLRPVTPDNISRLDQSTTIQPEKTLTKPAPLTGVEVEPALADRPVTGVMIENSPDARPQSGLAAADVVFEAVTEGGITRFLALYQQTTPERIGPIRSVRLPFVDWFMGFDAPVAHVGGAPAALQLMQRRGTKTLNQFAHPGPYYRAGDRHAPHNMYSSIKDLRALQMRLGYTTSKFKTIPRSDDDPAENPGAPRVKINYSSSLYQAEFRYQAEANSYRRFMAGSQHIDRETGSAITVKNVVVIVMPSHQSGQYLLMNTIGSGEAVVFKDGRAHKVKWRQTSPRERIELIDSEGEQVPLNRGKTWFAILPQGRSLNY